MRIRLSLLVLATAGITLGVPGAMSGTASRAVSPAGTVAATPMAGSVVGMSVWLLAGVLGLVVCAIALGRRPVARADRLLATPAMVQAPAERTVSATPPRVATRIVEPAEPEGPPAVSVESGDPIGTASRQPAAV
jgi:hypothetical protein